jgi:hypothetical protein
VVEEGEADLGTLARLPPVRLDVGSGRRLGAVVPERLLPVREVEPDRGAPFAVGEADARLADRTLLRRQEAAAARENGRRRATVGAERPRVRLHPLDVDAAAREARIDPRARLRPILAVEDAGNEPARIVRRR